MISILYIIIRNGNTDNYLFTHNNHHPLHIHHPHKLQLLLLKQYIPDYSELFSLFGTGGAPVYPRLSPYQTDLTWASVQSPIINSSFYWRGFTISSPAKLISFDASLGAVD